MAGQASLHDPGHAEGKRRVTTSRRRIRDYFKRYRFPFAMGIVFLVLMQGFALSVPPLLKDATDALNTGDMVLMRRTALLLVAVAVGGSVVRILSRVLIFNSGRKVEHDLRNDLLEHLTRLSPSFYDEMQTGQIMSRSVNDLTQVRLLLGPGLLNLTNTVLVYAVVVPLLLYTDFWLAVASLSVLPTLVIAGRWMGRRIYEFGREAQERLGALSTKVQENLGGVMTVRAYRREDAELERFTELNGQYFATNVRLARLRGTLFPLMGVFGASGGIILLYMGGQRMIAGQMTIGEFVQFNGYLATLTWPTIALGWMISLWQRGIAAMDRINEVFNAEPRIVDGAMSAAPGPGKIDMQGLSFAYSNSAQPALLDVNATIAPGETVVIVGRTGSGKSTLLRALTRLIEIPKGCVQLDGTDLVDLPLAAIRSKIAYAPQDAFLFSRTIAENVRFGRPDATDAEVKEAVRKAGLLGDIEGFPEGLKTIVGERGVTLSGGQRQRTALARALLVDAPILLLDDTLSAVDTETETKILEELASGDGRTTILVTHRLAGASGADRILVMDGGQIIEQGTEAELLARGGIYTAMHRRQRLRQAMQSGAHAPAAVEA